MQRTVFVLSLCSSVVIGTFGRSDDSSSDPELNDVTGVVSLLQLVIDADEQTARDCLDVLTQSVQNGQLTGAQLDALQRQLDEQLRGILADSSHPLRVPVAILATAWKDPAGMQIARRLLQSATAKTEDRKAALEALVAAGDSQVVRLVRPLLADRQAGVDFRGDVLAALSRLNQPQVPRLIIDSYEGMEPELRPRAIEVLTQRPEWSLVLLKAIQAKRIEKDALNLNQLKRLALFEDEILLQTLREIYGAIRQDRRTDRQQVINRMGDFLQGTPGDPHRGMAAFKKVCGQCHKIYGEGAEVGPDITRNGRNNWNQLLQNVFDPSAVIGPGYQARTLVTDDGRVLTGLPVEESDQRVVLKIQGGKTETIPRDRIEAYAVSEMSMMPEDLEKQLKPQEIADLFAFLALDKPPSAPDARLLPGAPAPQSR